jgi:hypothetical protein
MIWIMSRFAWRKTTINLENGQTVPALAPVVISASRATDIPACFGDWFLKQLNKGYCTWINPFNGKETCISFENTRLIVFWTKNPDPFLGTLKILDQRNFSYFFQFTINDYDIECFEKQLPSLEARIVVLRKLAKRIGRNRILWRFDPLILTDTLDAATLLSRISRLGDQLSDCVSRLTISFLSPYKTVIRRMHRAGTTPRQPTEDDIRIIGEQCAAFGRKWGIEVVSCAETAPLHRYGIMAGSCIDPVYIRREFSDDALLMDFIGSVYRPSLFDDETDLRRSLKDPGQRNECLCMYSKDIGRYGTCTQGCLYCYAQRGMPGRRTECF